MPFGIPLWFRPSLMSLMNINIYKHIPCESVTTINYQCAFKFGESTTGYQSAHSLWNHVYDWQSAHLVSSVSMEELEEDKKRQIIRRREDWSWPSLHTVKQHISTSLVNLWLWLTISAASYKFRKSMTMNIYQHIPCETMNMTDNQHI